MDRNRLTRIVWGAAVVVTAAAVYTAVAGPPAMLRAGGTAAVVAGSSGDDGACAWGSHDASLAQAEMEGACGAHDLAAGSACAHDGANAGGCDACPFMQEGGAKAAGQLTGHVDASRTGACEAACSAHVDADAVTLVAQPGAAEGDYTRCPVSGVVFAVTGVQPHFAWQGADYYTCCDGCAKALARDPGRYITS